jgi:hypothetical protein
MICFTIGVNRAAASLHELLVKLVVEQGNELQILNMLQTRSCEMIDVRKGEDNKENKNCARYSRVGGRLFPSQCRALLVAGS